MKKNFYNEEFVIFDVETTGLSPGNGDRIIEIAALKIKDFKPVDTFHSLINPEREISYGAYLVNGITQEILEGAPQAREILPSFLDFIRNTSLVGHNIGFDLGFLQNELYLIRKKWTMEKTPYDTLKMARALMPSLGSHSLWMVAQALGIEQQQQHRALADVYLTYHVFCKLVDLAKQRAMDHIDIFRRLFGLSGDGHEAENREKVSLIEEAIQEKKELSISYFSQTRAAVTSRTVTPKKVVVRNKKEKLVGYCHLRQEERDFRIDRILHLKKL